MSINLSIHRIPLEQKCLPNECNLSAFQCSEPKMELGDWLRHFWSFTHKFFCSIFPPFARDCFFAFEALLGGDKETLNGLAIAGFSRNRQCAQSLGSIARAEGDKGQQMRFLTPRSPADRALITCRALCVYARAHFSVPFKSLFVVM